MSGGGQAPQGRWARRRPTGPGLRPCGGMRRHSRLCAKDGWQESGRALARIPRVREAFTRGRGEAGRSSLHEWTHSGLVRWGQVSRGTDGRESRRVCGYGFPGAYCLAPRGTGSVPSASPGSAARDARRKTASAPSSVQGPSSTPPDPGAPPRGRGLKPGRGAGPGTGTGGAEPIAGSAAAPRQHPRPGSAAGRMREPASTGGAECTVCIPVWKSACWRMGVFSHSGTEDESREGRSM